MDATHPPPVPRWPLSVLATWAALAALLAATVDFREVPRPAVPAVIWGPLLLWLVAAWHRADLRAWLRAFDLRWLIGLHLLRVPIGVVFLVLADRGELAPEFAHVAGPGDIAAGLLAIAAFAAARVPVTGGRRTLLLVWNALALLDLVVSVASAQRVLWLGAGPDGLRGFAHFPLEMLPAFLVPLLLGTHLVIFWRLRRPVA